MQRQFNLLPSRTLAIILLFVYSVTALALFALALPLWAVVPTLLLLLSSLLLHVRRDAWLSTPFSPIKLAFEGEEVVLTIRNGEQLNGKLLQHSLITPFLTILNVLPHGAFTARSIVILPDSMDSESFRQLRVWLKWANPDYVP